MLKREQMVKQFELLTKQEIKNHNDQILSSNKRINSVAEGLEIQRRMYERKIGELQARVDDLEAKFADMKCHEDNHVYHRDRVEGKFCRDLNEMWNYVYNVENCGMLREQDIFLLREQAAEMKRALSQQKERFSEQDKLFSQHLDKLERALKKHVNCREQDIISRTCEHKEDVKDIYRQLKQIHFSIKCVNDEMENHKEKRFYNEKQTEHALNLIERLKKRLEV